MSITIDHPNSPSDLYTAATALDDARFDRLLDDLLRVRAGRRVSKVGAGETELLSRVNAGPPADVWAKYRELQTRRDSRTLTTTDQTELIRLTDAVEQFQADRAAALSELATLRGQTLRQLADTLGLSPPTE